MAVISMKYFARPSHVAKRLTGSMAPTMEALYSSPYIDIRWVVPNGETRNGIQINVLIKQEAFDELFILFQDRKLGIKPYDLEFRHSPTRKELVVLERNGFQRTSGGSWTWMGSPETHPELQT